MKFNGIDLADRYTSSAGGYFIVNDVRGRGVLGSEVDMIDVPGRDGSYVIGKRRPPRTLEVDITLKGDSYEDLRKKIEDLNALLSTETDAEIVFDDEPDRVYYGRLTEVNDKLEKSKIYQATLTFICPDPYKYGPLRTQTIAVPPASFSRNSVAYLSDGTQVAANQPRFEQGGVLVEEGTTNLVPNPIAKTDLTAISSMGPGRTLERVTSLPSGLGITTGLKFTVTTSGDNNIMFLQTNGTESTSGIPVSANTAYSFSAWVYIESGLSVALRPVEYNSSGEVVKDNTNLAVTNKIGQWIRLNGTLTTQSSTARISFRILAIGTGVVYVTGAQLEQKPYATSFVDGTRQPERLTLSTDGVLNPEEGTIECFVNVNDVLKRVDGTFRVLWYALPVGGIANGRFLLDHDGSASRWRIVTGNPSGIKAYFVPDSYTPNGWHLFSITYNQKSKSIKFFIDGVLRLSVSDAFLPSSFGNFFIGLAQENARWANAIFGPLRISRIARSDAEILDAYQNGFTVDEHTTAYLPFDGDLNVQTPNIVVNEGTAETYPTFTAYVKQPITFLDIISPDSYMRVGQPYEVSQTPVDGDVRVLNDSMSTLTGWGSASAIDGGVIQGSFHVVGDTFRVKDYGPTYNGWAGPALKKSVPNLVQDFQVKALIDITSSANGVGRIEIYGLDTENNFVFRMGIGDFSAKSKDVKAYWELGPSTDTIFTTYGKKKGMLNDYYGILVIQRKGNKWTFYTARRTSAAPVANYVDYVQSTFVDTKSKYTGQLAQIQIHIGTHLSHGPISHMSINHIEVTEFRDTAADQIPYIAYPDDVLQFDHKNAVVYRNGEPIMWAKDFGASFFALKPGATELAANPSDAAIVEIEYRPRYK